MINQVVEEILWSDYVRRKQTALIISILMISSLVFISQTRPQSPVSSTNPILADGNESPVTDQDGDSIPDLYEVIFGETLIQEINSQKISVEGLNPSDSTDNTTDYDRDGLTSLQEYCWPYTLEICFDERNTLTGKSPEESSSGLREYLDPRKSDTDGDGLPDGYEVYMCTTGGMYSNNPIDPISQKKFWECQYFDPLDPRDNMEDFDRCDLDFSWGCGDGFDFNSDGIIDLGERFTNTEEYLFGSPEDWITEIDGLWCSGEIFGLTEDSCQTEFSLETGESGWLGSDPRFSDSDYYYWDDIIPVGLEILGDGIIDGWEAHHGLDPRNSSDAIIDSDNDGWDSNRDGIITPDITTSTSIWGEALSNFEEFLIDYDDSNGVTSGLTGFSLSENSNDFLTYHHSTPIDLIDTSINSIISDQSRNRLYVSSMHGITTLDPFSSTSSKFIFESGLYGRTLTKSSLDNYEYLFLGSNIGFHIIRLVNGLPSVESIINFEIGEITEILELKNSAEKISLLLMGNSDAWTFSLDNNFSNDGTNIPSPVHEISDNLLEFNASVTSAIHAEFEERIPLLLVGTDKGLLGWNYTDGIKLTDNPWWIFNVSTAEFFVNTDIFNPSNSATVNTMLDVSRDSESSEVWIGTTGGLHTIDLDLLFSQPTKAFDSERMLSYDGLINGANNIHSILPIDDRVIVGSKDGTWALEGRYDGILGEKFNQTKVPGLITDLVSLDYQDEKWIFAAVSPGRYLNIAPMNPFSSDSDLDGMSDGWEFHHGLDPTNPYDAERDLDSDGVTSKWNNDIEFTKDWNNLDEYRFQSSNGGYNGTDPRNSDSDGDGLTDGQEYWGWFLDSTNFTCFYMNNKYTCDSEKGANAREIHQSGLLLNTGGGTDFPTNPTNSDSDGDGMPDGWEISNRRWIGDTYTGGNNWTLNPMDPTDANKDSDGDGLTNLCEYEWSLIHQRALREGIPSHGESAIYAQNWYSTDPNSIDSDFDSLPDGWEARYSCNWPSLESGINPMNGSDYLNNPDGDGFDINLDGIISLDESLVNWMEYHLKSEILLETGTSSGITYPNNFSTALTHESWNGISMGSFGDFVGDIYVINSQNIPLNDVGSSNPLDSDSDNDGMPDGWEFFHSRWSLFDQKWTLNPVNLEDRFGDPDGDGMNNWEEYNSINSSLSESNPSISVPQFYISQAGSFEINAWLGAKSELSFGNFISKEQSNFTGYTTDPNNPDTDGDGILDGIELIFTSWNETNQVWSLNPLIPGDGIFDSDRDGISDIIELNLSENRPINGGLSPTDAPLFWEEADLIDNSETIDRIYRILYLKEGRAQIAMNQYNHWINGNPPGTLIEAIIGITDPQQKDTDRDGMTDGYEYWFSEWNLESNKWTINPLTNSDTNFDSDGDSYDCNGDGEITDSELFHNLAEYDSRRYGKRLAVGSFNNASSIISYGDDTIQALIDENLFSKSAAQAELYNLFYQKSPSSTEKMGLINSLNTNNFNETLSGISDPTHPDSDGDGMPDGWEYCYSEYMEVLPVNDFRWSLNPVNPLDINYDPDADGWYDRLLTDMPATQGKWEEREFSPYPQDQQFQQGITALYFTNIMEYLNQTNPLNPDSDFDSKVKKPVFLNEQIISYQSENSLSDGLEIFKFGTNPLDNDTDGDMLPDFYEHFHGWNESNGNWSSYLQIQVQWEEVTPNNWKPIQISNGTITRPKLEWTWFNLDPTNPNDATEDPDNDGEWDCSISPCSYVPYNNFQEFYAVVNVTLSSPSIVRASSLYDCSGDIVSEWWQLRESLLGTCSGTNSVFTNYLRMNRISDSDPLYALIIDDNDENYELVNYSDDIIFVNGAWTDSYNRLAGDKYHLPNIALGEFPYGWWILDIDGDNIADGTNPKNWDTDGDWLNDYFEIKDDLLDGIRGNSGSPIRYDDRTT